MSMNSIRIGSQYHLLPPPERDDDVNSIDFILLNECKAESLGKGALICLLAL